MVVGLVVALGVLSLEASVSDSVVLGNDTEALDSEAGDVFISFVVVAS